MLQDTPRSSRKGLQSCVNLGDEGGFGSPVRGSFPRRQVKELGQVGLQDIENIDKKKQLVVASGPGISRVREPEPRLQDSKPLFKAQL